MFRSFKVQKKIVAIWSLFSIFLNIAQPAFIALTFAPLISPSIAKAEDLVPSPTPEPTPIILPSDTPSVEPSASPIESIAPSPDPTIEPSTDPTPSPTPDATLAPSVTPDSSLLPSDSPTPTPNTDQPANPTPNNDSSPAPPSSDTNTNTPAPTTTPVISPTPSPEFNEQLNISIVDNTAAQSIQVYDLTVTETGSATLATDKADYAPTDTAIITGAGFLKNTTYKLVISSTDEPATSTTVDVKTDADGTLFYAYQLDGNYRSNYKVEAYLESVLVATITFTDSPAVQLTNGSLEGQKKDGTWVNGNLCAGNGSCYSEGNQVLHSEKFNSLSAGSYYFLVSHDYQCKNDGTIGYVDFNNAQNFSGASNVTLASYDLSDVNKHIWKISFDVIGNHNVEIRWNAHLSDHAGGCSGSNLHAYNEGGGNESVQLPVGNINILGSILPTKSSANGADPTQWTFNITGNTNVSGVASGSIAQNLSLNSGNANATYTITESGPSGWTLDSVTSPCTKISANSASVILSSSTPDVSCTFTNKPLTGSIVVHKDVQGPNGEALTDISTNFTIQRDGANSQSVTDGGTVTYNNVTSGNHTITETSVPSTYSLYGIATSAGANGNTSGLTINVPSAGTADVYVTNRQNNATVTIHKNVLNPDGGEVADTHNFNVLRGGSDSKNMAEGTDAKYTLAPGTYTFTEGTDTDYVLDSITGDNDTDASNGVTLTVAPGSTSSLTFVNKQKKATITVNKNVVAPNGTTDVLDNHTFSVTLNGEIKDFSENSSASFTVNPGTYSAVEGTDDNYTLVSNDSPKTVGSNGSAAISIVNKQKSATVEVIKDVLDPDGNAVADNHSFSAKMDGGASQSFSENSITSFSVDPGMHTVTEVADTNYTYVGCAPDLDFDTASAQLNLASNQTVRITCTNWQKKATVTVYKDVVKNDGSATDDAHLFSVTVDSVKKLFGEGNSQTFTVNPGTYRAVEGAEANYAYVSDTGSVTVSSNGAGSITVTNKQNVGSISGYKFNADESTPISGWTIQLLSCAADYTNCVLGTSTTTNGSGYYSFSNLLTGLYQVREVLQDGWSNLTDLSHNLTVTAGSVLGNNNFTNFQNVSVKACKLEDADGILTTTGDRSLVSGWTVKLLTDGKVSDTQTTGSDGCYTWSDLGPGYSYGTSESITTGWTALSDTTHDFGTATSGATYEYTFINFENAKIVVHKNVLGTNGTTDVSDSTSFASLLDGTNSKTIAEGTNSEYADLGPGSYTVSEDIAPTGYSLVSITNNGIVNVTSGTASHVYVVNKQNSANLTVIKHVVNDNNGNAVSSNFTMNVTGINLSDDSFPGSESGTTITLDAGAYTVNESNFTSYEKSLGSNCSGTIKFGESKTCTITNDDIAPTLTVIKKVLNDNGGNAVVTDFDIELNKSNLTFGIGDTDGDTTTYISTPTVSSNTSYALSEIDFEGYTEGTWSCTDNDTEDEIALPVTLNEGQNVTCEITNDDDAPTITLNKVLSGGSASVDDFGLTIGATSVTSGQTLTVDSNTPYALNEAGLAGYTFTSLTGDRGCPEALTGTVTLDEGQNITCTITNTRDTGTIKIIKDAVPNNSQDFTFSTTGGGTLPASFKLDDDNKGGLPKNRIFTVPTGDYSVTESIVSGWQLTGLTCTDSNNSTWDLDSRVANLSVETGENITCTFTNTKYGSIAGRKYNDLNGNGQRGSSEPYLDAWTIHLFDDEMIQLDSIVTGSGSLELGQYKFTNLLPGTYNICEVEQTGWVQTDPGTGCRQITLTAGEPRTGVHFGNFKLGKVSGYKWYDANEDGIKDASESVLSGWTINLGDSSEITDKSGYYEFTGLTAGSYALSEEMQPGWAQTHDPATPLVMTSGLSLAQQNFGNRGNLSLRACKFEDSNGSLKDGEFSDVNGWNFTLGDNAQNTSDDDDEIDNCTTFTHLIPGEYSVTEGEESGWYSADGQTTQTVTLTDEKATLNFYNYQKGSISGFKWNDINGNGERDCDQNENNDERKECNYREEKLAGWTIFIDTNDNQKLDSNEEEETEEVSALTDENGNYSFDDLEPGSYSICEVEKDDWTQTYPNDESKCHNITINSGDNLSSINFGNQEESALRIQKSNNATGSKNPGDLVTYTLVVDLEGSSLGHVLLTDVTPDGFTYVAGSWTSSKAGVPEPDYGSPGTWNLGDMEPGDSITLTYQVKISADQDGGIYNDLAWAEGSSEGWGGVLALGHDSEYVDADKTFVGTDVEVTKSVQQTGSVDIEREGEVLGASTELPATGADSNWLLLALGALITGLFLIFGGKRMQKVFIGALIFVASFSVTPVTTYATESVDTMSVRIEQPASPTRINEWKLSFSVLDRALGTPVVNCYVKKPGSGSFIAFGATHTSAKTMGDNGNCQVNSGVMSEQGDYYFYVTAVSGSYSENSDTVTVKYDTSGPSAPTSYSKEHPSSCKWIIKFHTADDGGATTKVEIYSSDSKSFDTHNGTRVGTVNIGSNQDGTFTHDRADNCDREWYYVIRAFDAAGNQSDHRGDEMVTVTTVTSSPTAAALVTTSANGSILGKQDSKEEVSEGEVLGDESSASAEVVEGNGLMDSAKEAVKNTAKNKTFLWIFITIIALRIVYGIARKEK